MAVGPAPPEGPAAVGDTAPPAWPPLDPREPGLPVGPAAGRAAVTGYPFILKGQTAKLFLECLHCLHW